MWESDIDVFYIIINISSDTKIPQCVGFHIKIAFKKLLLQNKNLLDLVFLNNLKILIYSKFKLIKINLETNYCPLWIKGHKCTVDYIVSALKMQKFENFRKYSDSPSHIEVKLLVGFGQILVLQNKS